MLVQGVLVDLKVAVTGLFGLVIGYVLYTKFSRSRLPPGPIPLPLLGSALWVLGRPLHVTFSMLRKRYGDITSIRVGSKEVVIINGYEKIQKALVSEGKKFNGRPDITWTGITKKQGLFSAEGAFYSKQKAVVLGILSKIDWSRSEAAEERINRISRDLISWISSTEGKPIDPQIYLDTAVCNVNSSVVIGVEFKPTDDLMVALSKIAMEIFLDAGAPNVNNYFSFLRNIPGDPTNYGALVKNATTAMSVLQDVISGHKKKLADDPAKERLDFIDHYLDKINSATEPTCTESQLLAVITDLIAMGIEATSATLRWALLLVAQHPDTQAKLQVELDEVIGDSQVRLEHKAEMPYTRAFIAEVQRYVNIVSINLPHSTTEDVTFQGYDIPAGTIVLPNLASVHYDPTIFPEPHKFNPDRHMDGDCFLQPKELIPYSLGSRICLGKVLSEMQLFLFLADLLKNFRIDLSGSVGADKYGLIRYAGDFKLTFKQRNK